MHSRRARAVRDHPQPVEHEDPDPFDLEPRHPDNRGWEVHPDDVEIDVV
ncbi:MAG: hypothetical protein AB7P03_07750 [Kofleriaceae bacterium]